MDAHHRANARHVNAEVISGPPTRHTYCESCSSYIVSVFARTVCCKAWSGAWSRRKQVGNCVFFFLNAWKAGHAWRSGFHPALDRVPGVGRRSQCVVHFMHQWNISLKTWRNHVLIFQSRRVPWMQSRISAFEIRRRATGLALSNFSTRFILHLGFNLSMDGGDRVSWQHASVKKKTPSTNFFFWLKQKSNLAKASATKHMQEIEVGRLHLF